MTVVNLTPKQEKFAQKYVECGNASEAYRYAYNCEQMKPESVHRLAKTNLDKVKIRSRVKVLQAETAKALLVSSESVLREFARNGFSDIRQLFLEDGTLKPIHSLDDDIAAAISSVEVVTKTGSGGEVEYVHKIKLWPKNPALESLSKNLGLYAKENNQLRPNFWEEKCDPRVQDMLNNPDKYTPPVDE